MLPFSQAVDRFCKIPRLVALCLMAFGAASAGAEPSSQADLKALGAADIRVASVGERLAMTNVHLCDHKRPRTGLVLHDLRQYSVEAQAAARFAFRFDREISVEGVVPGSPAERAGIKPNSALLALDGIAIATLPAPRSENSFGRMSAVLDQEEREAADGILMVEVLEEGVERRRKIVAATGCSARFQLVLEGSRNALADGQYVQIDGGMLDFVRSDEELSAVLAHELAHIILDHRRRLHCIRNERKIARVTRRTIVASEDEADRLSLYLMANAGYDPPLLPAIACSRGKSVQVLLSCEYEILWCAAAMGLLS